ncbi:hypothetical protein GCM10007971_11040 [Oceanobacillus indicireducens]|uniref:Uncharacterized protein n=1 Tax=Oceanobacillus indicireducens TaxID=1004261 RepID=A0A918D0E4_9BACI|nr:hypothetical protein GCM10007971_11040 [Oceanobacillus indicireducens]
MYVAKRALAPLIFHDKFFKKKLGKTLESQNRSEYNVVKVKDSQSQD